MPLENASDFLDIVIGGRGYRDSFDMVGLFCAWLSFFFPIFNKNFHQIIKISFFGLHHLSSPGCENNLYPFDEMGIDLSLACLQLWLLPLTSLILSSSHVGLLIDCLTSGTLSHVISSWSTSSGSFTYLIPSVLSTFGLGVASSRSLSLGCSKFALHASFMYFLHILSFSPP